MQQTKLKRNSVGVLINTDREGLAKRRHEKNLLLRIKDLEDRIEKLEKIIEERDI